MAAWPTFTRAEAVLLIGHAAVALGCASGESAELVSSAAFGAALGVACGLPAPLADFAVYMGRIGRAERRPRLRKLALFCRRLAHHIDDSPAAR